MKKIFILLIATIVAFSSKATVILDETFNYTDFSSATGWTTSGSLLTGTGRVIGGTAMEYFNDGGIYVLSEEGKLLTNDYSTGTSGDPYISLKEFTPVTSGSVYLSYLYRANVAQNQTNSEALGVAMNATYPAARLWVGKNTSGNPFKVGVVRSSTAGGDIQWASNQMATAKVYLIVIKYDFAASKASLFIDPVINSATEPEPNAYDDTKGSARNTISYLMFRNTGSNKSVYDISGVRVSTTWAEAVAKKITAPNLSTPVAEVATDVTENSFTANWSTIANAVGYIVKLYKNNIEVGTYEAAGQAAESLLIEGLASATDYTYSVIAKGDGTNYSNSAESDKISFTTEQALSYDRINTDFGDGTWGVVTPSTEAPAYGAFPSNTFNGFQLQNAVLISGTVVCQSGASHTNRILLDKLSNKGAIEFPLLKTVGEVEIHANAGTAGNPFTLQIWENNDWTVVGTYSTKKTQDSIYIIPLMKAGETKLRIANASSGGVYVFKILTRTYQESQELNVTGTTPDEGTSCYYNLTKNIILTLNKDVEVGTGTILLNDTPITVDASMINGKVVTIPVSLESTTSGKSYTVTVSAGAFVEKGNTANQSKLKVFSFTTVKTVAYPSNYSSQIDVVYSTASAASNRMDVYYPTGDGLRSTSRVPVVINIHGGGWNHGEKESQGGFNIYFNQGYVVANMEYRLTSEGTAPAAIEDARCAMMYLLKHADEFNIDPNKIVFQGGSAGAHIALTAAYLQKDGRFDTGCNDYSGDYKIVAVIDKYGPTDMLELKNTYSSAANWLGNKQTDEDFVKSVSPAYLVSSTTPPTYIIHGDADPTIPYSHSVLLADKLQAQGIKYQFTTVPGGEHGGFSTEYNNQMNDEIVAFLTQVLSNTVSIDKDNVDNKVGISYTNGVLSIQSDADCLTSVYDVTGRKLISSENKEINIPQDIKGVLLIKVEINKRVYTYKVVS